MKEIKTYTFKEALELMQQGKKVKYPHWGGFWYWDNTRGTIIMHTKDGEDIDLFDTQRKEYTLNYMASDGFVLLEEKGEQQNELY